ncbi:hypothetical protein ES705_21976 [subsurface metagenome]
MNHTNLAKLLIYLGDSPNQLRTGELEEYIWLTEQLLQELRQHQVLNREAKPLAPFTRP